MSNPYSVDAQKRCTEWTTYKNQVSLSNQVFTRRGKLQFSQIASQQVNNCLEADPVLDENELLRILSTKKSHDSQMNAKNQVNIFDGIRQSRSLQTYIVNKLC